MNPYAFNAEGTIPACIKIIFSPKHTKPAPILRNAAYALFLH
jgi:hypothetical protein